MAMTTTDLSNLDAAIAKIDEIRDLVKGSLSIQAMGGDYIFNEIAKLDPILASIRADLAAELGVS